MSSKKKKVEGIVNTGPRQPRVDPDWVAKQLGAEKCKLEDLPPNIQRAAKAAGPFLGR